MIKKIIKENIHILKKIKNKIKKSEKIAIIGHINPDGDCIGCQVSLYYSLLDIGKYVKLFNAGKFEIEYVKKYENLFEKEIKDKFDLYIIVDTSSPERIGEISKQINYNKSIVIDHHISNMKFGKINWISDNYISASEMIFILFKYLKIGLNNHYVVQILLNGILSDNGYFLHIRKDKYLSLYLVYLLVKLGGDPKLSYDMMFANNTLKIEKLFGLVLNRIESVCDGKILWVSITESERSEYGELHTGMVFREMMSIKNIKIAIIFKIYDSENRVDVSFRSTDDIDVSKIAIIFGGGGHKVAAGASLQGNFLEIKEKILSKTIQLFNNNELNNE